MKRTAYELAALARLLDQALEMPASQQEGWIASLEGQYAPLRDTLRDLLSQEVGLETSEFAGMQRRIAGMVEQRLQSGNAEVHAGLRVGPYRLERELGKGGMGSVWLAQRADGAFSRTVALKLPRTLWIDDLAARMARERDILASLQHEHIARFYDAGVDQAGRPYIAMECVQGVPIDEYCRTRALSIEQILTLILQVCRALAHAHSRLIVHRDLKPGNILVSEEQGVRLLDFGIAALISEEPGSSVTQFAGRMLTLDYSSPEQIRGESVGTPSDVYSLAVVSYEVLTDKKPYELGSGSIAQAAQAILEIVPRAASEVAPPSRRSGLRGDLDAILNKALKKDPGERYASMGELADDIDRHLRQVPVRARPDRVAYRARKFVARYRWQLSAAVLVFAAVLVGGGVALWQAHTARLEAHRADVIKDFLVDILRTNDIRIPTDGPRGERTVKEVLDAAASRVERQFAGQPELQVELLDLIAVIYDNSGEMGKYHEVEARRAELARRYYGPGHPQVISGLVAAAKSAVDSLDFPAADRLLVAADAQFKAAGREDPELRADWLRIKARYLTKMGDMAEHDRLIEQAVALYRQVGRNSAQFAATLSSLSRVRSEQGRSEEALRLMREAVKVGEAAEPPDSASLSTEYLNLARELERADGGIAEAHAVYGRAQTLAAQTWGKQSRNYFMSLIWDVGLLQLSGDRAGAAARMSELEASLPAMSNGNDTQMAWHSYAQCLMRDGRVAEAIPLLESVERAYLANSSDQSDLRIMRRDLGDAYELTNRVAEARERLQSSRDEYIAKEIAGSRWQMRARERWGRFLLDHSRPDSADFAAAETEFKAVTANTGEHAYSWEALAYAGLARVALARGEAAPALAASRQSLARLAQVQGLVDVRYRAQLWVIYSDALLANGDAAGARDWATKAREASIKYEYSTSPGIAAANAALRRANAALSARGLVVGWGRPGKQGPSVTRPEAYS
jgi:serine/threonine-protein kinase